MKPETKAAFTRLFAVIKWRFSSKKFVGTRIYFMGKMRTVTAETFDLIALQGIQYMVKKDSRYLRIEKDKKNKAAGFYGK